MSRGISVATFYLVLQYGLFMFVYPQSVIQSQPSGHWFVIILGWLFQGILLRLLVGGLRAEKTDLLLKFQQAGKWFRYCLVWPFIISNILAIGVIVRGHAQILSILYLPHTPLWVLFAMLLVTALSVSYAGRDSLLRLSLVIGSFGLPLAFLSFLSAVKYMNILMIFPLKPTLDFMDEPRILPAISVFVNVFALIGFFGPYAASEKRWLWGAWVVSLFLFLSNVYLPISAFGQEVADDLRFPLILLLDTVRVKWFFFERISLFYIMAILFSTLINISGLLWLTRQLAINSSIVPRLITNPVTVGALGIVVAFYIPSLEALEQFLRSGGPLRFGLLFILSIASVYYRNRAKIGGQPRA
ncbi:GerAB/ArcD/ProY family transporter [Paenibacillus rhizovicinus]|uniref:GerAB/ArcD/ProY family transporter n=1 Tax=Paenibacillus rhizovicinus TaxID=2704463 RepID=A0A6C0NYF3_9BACL|nr:GerAB/ArcD/ProY family transporter [Paenibacillus rhizovicinus]QHW31161.1 GerAB/ArcD/ProY family transporter [Paenibacillus rhizovicinus]